MKINDRYDSFVVSSQNPHFLLTLLICVIAFLNSNMKRFLFCNKKLILRETKTYVTKGYFYELHNHL